MRPWTWQSLWCGPWRPSIRQDTETNLSSHRKWAIEPSPIAALPGANPSNLGTLGSQPTGETWKRLHRLDEIIFLPFFSDDLTESIGSTLPRQREFFYRKKKKNVAKKIDPLLGAASCKHVGHVTSHYLRRWVHKTNRNQNHESPSMKTFVATCCDTWTTSQYLLSKSPYRKQYNFQAAPTVPQPPGSGHSSWHVSYTSRGRWCLGIPKVSYQAHPEVWNDDIHGFQEKIQNVPPVS